MEVSIFGRKAEICWNYFFIAAAVPLAITLLVSFTGFAYGFVSGLNAAEAVYSVLLGFVPVYAFLSAPLAAFLLLVAARTIFKMQMSKMLSLSIALADFILWGVGLAFAGLVASFMLGLYGADLVYAFVSSLSGFVNTLLNAAVSAVSLYLWMLIFIKPDSGRLKNAALPAVIFAVTAVILGSLLPIILSYSGHGIGLPSLSYTDLPFAMASGFIFAYPIIYHIKNRQLGCEALLFAFAYAAPFAITIAAKYFSPWAFDPLPYISSLLLTITKLALLFFISESGSPDISKL